MTTVRRPVRPAAHLRITAQVIETFLTMEAARFQCTCPDHRRGEWVPRCEVCERWWVNHSALHTALALPPWRWPAIVYADGPSPCGGGGYFREQALELYSALQEAARTAAA